MALWGRDMNTPDASSHCCCSPHQHSWVLQIAPGITPTLLERIIYGREDMKSARNEVCPVSVHSSAFVLVLSCMHLCVVMM